MLHFLEGGAEALCKPRPGASVSSSSTESKRESNVGEVQFGYDNRGLYGASNERGISVVVLKALFKAVAESDISSEDEESPLPRAIVRIKQILDFVPEKKPLNPKMQTFTMAAEGSTWANNVGRHLSGADEPVRVELTNFLFAVRSGHGLETALNYENDTAWPGGTAVLHAELRILNAAWIAGSGDLLLTGAKRACWGCHCVLEDVNSEALLQRSVSVGGTSGEPVDTPSISSSSSAALPSSSSVAPPTMTRSRSISPPRTSMGPESPMRPSSPTMASSSMLSSASAMMGSTLPTSTSLAGSTLLAPHVPEYFRILRLADEDLSGWAFSDTYCGLHGAGRSETTRDPATMGSTLTRRRSLVWRY
ncbi:hypothetical protein GTP81_14800 [Rugamonas sp. FT107W]|uniref:Uncharacterized protein n=1 Tax=Duganella vulcania TaxID=2692166 RepID=A0A845HNE5_9BURK|nr:hypothetical protein [Duganella vulcania]MYN18026.1 hypothetical protein [Duganella vulcania]